MSLVAMLLAPQANAADGDELPHYERSGLFLTWNAPYPDERATDVLTTACDDTARIDTLYLTFALERALPDVQAMSATLFFHPFAGDTLEPFWFFKRGWDNQGNMLIELHPSHGLPCEMPWKSMGAGAVSYDHRSGRGRLDLVYGVDDSLAVPVVPDKRYYCLGRVLIHHRKAGLAGCLQPVCIEWGGAEVRYRGGRVERVEGNDYRFAGWNSDLGRSCSERMQHRAVKPWRPKVDGSQDSR